MEKGGIRALNELYVRFHKEAEEHPEYDDEARAYFKKIEQGDEECQALFKWFKELTLKDVQKIYEMLDIRFDSYAGESFYSDKMQPVVDELREKGLLTESRGAQVLFSNRTAVRFTLPAIWRRLRTVKRNTISINVCTWWRINRTCTSNSSLKSSN